MKLRLRLDVDNELVGHDGAHDVHLRAVKDEKQPHLRLSHVNLPISDPEALELVKGKVGQLFDVEVTIRPASV